VENKVKPGENAGRDYGGLRFCPGHLGWRQIRRKQLTIILVNPFLFSIITTKKIINIVQIPSDSPLLKGRILIKERTFPLS
jgi:hypothetical protein